MQRKVLKSYMLCAILILLCGCERHRLGFPELNDFVSKTKTECSNVKNIEADFLGDSLSINIEMDVASEENVFSILQKFQLTVNKDSFVNDFFQTFSATLKDLNDWNNGYRPDIYVYFNKDGISQYSFTARYYREGYNPGLDPSGYSIDRYKTWYGTNHITGAVISPEEIEKAIS